MKRFDLESEIRAWRRRMLRNLNSKQTRELESHLRDAIANLCAEGMDEQAAFRRAEAELGNPQALEVEFGKTAGWFLLHKQALKRVVSRTALGALVIAFALFVFQLRSFQREAGNIIFGLRLEQSDEMIGLSEPPKFQRLIGFGPYDLVCTFSVVDAEE